MAAATPDSAEDQLRVLPTAKTIVNASTASTAQARKTEIARLASAPLMSRNLVGMDLPEDLRRSQRCEQEAQRAMAEVPRRFPTLARGTRRNDPARDDPSKQALF